MMKAFHRHALLTAKRWKLNRSEPSRFLSTVAIESHSNVEVNHQDVGAFESSPPEPDIAQLQPKTSMNLVTSVNKTLHSILKDDPSSITFGQDIAFGGVFRCTTNLQESFGKNRVFSTPLNETGIVGLAVGYASTGSLAIAEIQFADYIFPAFDQLKNEASMFRYRSGNQWNCGSMVVRMPYGAVGHGGHYHSQSPEAFLTHIPGIVVMIPRGPISAKGMLLSAAKSKDPCVILEPKALYRAKVEDVPDEEYHIPIGKAEIMREGHDITIVGWGRQLTILEKACDMAQSEHGISCELIDLRTLSPWDVSTVENSVRKTGKMIVSHEAPITCGFGAEVVASIQDRCFLSLEAPIKRVCGYDMPFPLVFEKEYLPSEWKNLEAIQDLMEFSQ